MKKYFNKETVLQYLFSQLTGNFAGFMIGMSATGLVSQFFETRSIRNLWGLSAKKTLVDKATFGRLEWVISILIGFIVFEIVTKILGVWLKKNYPRIKFNILRWAVEHNMHIRSRELVEKINQRRVILFSAMNHTVAKRIFRK